ncbi:hypothetical protein ACFSUF_00120 [Paenibacillus gansuensis]|uniref:Uncharacterized protein n=1 Tax=Paenibacillus gansuensis TaxID=306542 RepID=A0ABW5P6G8_9BACL
MAAVGFGGFWGSVFLLFYTANIKEQIVERNGTKMLAEVSAFLDVNVYYYDYKNWFVRSGKYRIDEWYGNGGYNPLKNELRREPITVTYYDENGNYIGERRNR